MGTLVEPGAFGAAMGVAMVNDGPFKGLLESWTRWRSQGCTRAMREPARERCPTGTGWSIGANTRLLRGFPNIGGGAGDARRDALQASHEGAGGELGDMVGEGQFVP